MREIRQQMEERETYRETERTVRKEKVGLRVTKFLNENNKQSGSM